MTDPLLSDPDQFSIVLFERMHAVCPAVARMDLVEFRYAMENIIPVSGWDKVTLKTTAEIETLVNDSQFYTSIQLKPRRGERLIMDTQILALLQMLFVGLVTGEYPISWVKAHFTFDLRGFYFIHRTDYYNEVTIARMGGKPYRAFSPRQSEFEKVDAVGYKSFKEANAEIDQCFIETTRALVAITGTPMIIAIAGQTAAGKTEIVQRLRTTFQKDGVGLTTIEIDHFLTDRDYREANGIDSLGKDALHFDLLRTCMMDLCSGQPAAAPQYDFIRATSSHDIDGHLKTGQRPQIIQPAQIIFMEGNFPFLFPEIAQHIALKVMYITEDDIRLKRKWKRDMDYRKKYELYYFLNRYFREQYLMAQAVYLPQMEICDMIVDTTRGQFWARPAIQAKLEGEHLKVDT